MDEERVRKGVDGVQQWQDGEWMVRSIFGGAATKTYRCPGCMQEIRPGVAHVVVWRSGSADADGRRHWHNPCWQRRPQRPAPGQGRRKSR